MNFLRKTCAQAAAHGLCREAPGILDTAGNGAVRKNCGLLENHLTRWTPVTTAPGNISMTVRRASDDDSAWTVDDGRCENRSSFPRCRLAPDLEQILR